jgi:uncharacterized RDD family membrane protein YckC
MENTTLPPGFVLASINKRILNQLIDLAGYFAFAMMAAVMLGLFIGVTGLQYDTEKHAGILFGYPALILYYILFEWIIQKTFGKLLTKTKVVSWDGSNPSLGQVLLRTLVRFVPFEWIPMLGDDGMPLHDKWSKTRVVENARGPIFDAMGGTAQPAEKSARISDWKIACA